MREVRVMTVGHESRAIKFTVNGRLCKDTIAYLVEGIQKNPFVRQETVRHFTSNGGVDNFQLQTVRFAPLRFVVAHIAQMMAGRMGAERLKVMTYIYRPHSGMKTRQRLYRRDPVSGNWSLEAPVSSASKRLSLPSRL